MGKIAFTQAEIKRAIRGVEDAGILVGSVEITKDGTIRIKTPAETGAAPQSEIDKWFAK